MLDTGWERGPWGDPTENGPCSQAGVRPNYQMGRHRALGVAIVTADETHPFEYSELDKKINIKFSINKEEFSTVLNINL